jgi:integrase
VDLSRGLLMVSKSKTAGGEAREIPLTQRMLQILDEEQQPGFVFTLGGQPLSWIRKGFLGGVKRAGLRHFRFHDLRHTFNTRLMEAGVIADVRMALMGHSGGSRVHSLYTHVEMPIKREAIRKLEAWVNQQQHERTGKYKANARTEVTGSQGSETRAHGSESDRTQTVEEKDTGRSRFRPS